MLSVTVVVATYNSEKVISKTLDSILSNNYTNFNILVSDDASTDSTISILKKYNKKYKNLIVLYSKKNKGVLENCNILVENIQNTDIVMFCGHDDIFYKDKISKCVNLFMKNPEVVLVYHDVNVIYSNGKKIKFSDTQRPRESNAKNYLLYGTFSTASSVCVKNKILQKVKFKREANEISDYLMMYEVAKYGKIKYINKVLGEYHRHDHNLSNTLKSSEDFGSIKTGLYILEKYPEDTLGALVVLNRALFRLLLHRKKYLPFFFIAPIFSVILNIYNKIGKKRI